MSSVTAGLYHPLLLSLCLAAGFEWSLWMPRLINVRKWCSVCGDSLGLFSFNCEPLCCLSCSGHCRFLLLSFSSRPLLSKQHCLCLGTSDLQIEHWSSYKKLEKSVANTKVYESRVLAIERQSRVVALVWIGSRTLQPGSLRADVSFKLSHRESLVWTGLKSVFKNPLIYFLNLSSVLLFRLLIRSCSLFQNAVLIRRAWR